MVEEILDVVIVGCGSAAIAAALKLNQSKVANKFIILEAGQEIGGRCRTKELDKGLAVDIGASWIHDHAEDNRLT
jgi:phytoene dehydrogenase-like protein